MLERGTICRIRSTFGPIASGTLVEVLESSDTSATACLFNTPGQKFRENLIAHHIDWNGFLMEVDNLEARRYRVPNAHVS